MSAVFSRSSSTTPGYLASLCGKSEAQIRFWAPASFAMAPAERSPGSKLIAHWRRKYSLGLSESFAAAQE
jgi:hypothetical protein